MISGSTKRNKYAFCVNPATGRPIAVGGHTWRQLVRNNDISPQEERDNVVYKISGDRRFKTDREAIDHLTEEKERIILEIRNGEHVVPTNTNVVRRGVNRLVYQRKKISIDEILNKTVKSASHIIDEIRMGELELEDDLTAAQRQQAIANAIIARMAAPPEYQHIPPIMPTVCRSMAVPRTIYETDSDGFYSSDED